MAEGRDLHCLSPLGFVAPNTLKVLAEIGVSPAGLYSKGLNEIDLREYRLIINLSEHSLKGRIPPAYAGRVLNRPVLDPYGGTLAMYRQSRDAIQPVIVAELCRKKAPGL